MSNCTQSPSSVGNRVKIYCRDPTSFIEGVIEGCDTFGTIILSSAKETLVAADGRPISDEEIKQRQQQHDELAAQSSEDVKPPYKPIVSTEANPLHIVLADRVTQVELHSSALSNTAVNISTGVRAIRDVFNDALPRKRLFVSDVDTLLGRAICAKYGESRDWEIVGTKCATKATQDEQVPLSCSGVVPSYREDPMAFKAAVLRADVIVCPLRDDIHDAQAALRILSNTVFDNEKVFILVSSVLTWAATDKALKAKAAADEKAEKEQIRKDRIEAGENPDEDEEDEEQDGGANKDADEEQEPPPVFSDANDHERVPHPRYQHWRLLEQAAKFANSESLHTYVLTAGLLYGDGEEALADVFSAAWHREPLPICAPLGPNVIPTIHVRDLATAILNAGNAEEVQATRYMLAVDAGNNSWADIVTAVCKTMGDPNDEPALIETPLGGANRYFDYFSLDLRLEATNIGSLINDDEWVSQNGIVENMTKITKEFRAKHVLSPVRVAVVGPPNSGKSLLAKWIAEVYSIEYINIPEIIRYYTQHRQHVFKKLVAHREMKKLEAERRAAAEAAEEDGGEDGGAGNESGNTSVNSSARNAFANGNSKKSKSGGGGPNSIAGLVDTEALAAGDADLEDFDAEAAEDFEVQFSAKAPPPGASGTVRGTSNNNNDGNNSNYDGTEDGEENSRPPSSRRGPDDYEDGDDEDDGDGEGRKKAPIAPEVEAAEDKEEDEDDDEALQLLKEQLRLCNKVLSLKNPKDGRFIDHAIAVMARYKILHSAQGKNQGYILDGFPKTTRQASFTFSSDPDAADVMASLPDFDEEGHLPEEVLAPVDPEDDGELQSLMEAVDPEMMLDYAIVLDASDDVIVSRASSHGDDINGALARLYRRLAFYQKFNSRGGKPGLSVQSWLRAILTNADNGPSRSVNVMELNTDDFWPITGRAATEQVRRFLGATHVIHPTVEELEQEQRDAEVAAAQDLQERKEAERERKEKRAADEAHKQAVAASHSRRLATSSDEKQAANAVCSIPAQSYLTEYVAAPLATCVADVARVRPADPLHVLADSLYQYEAPIVKAREILTGEKRASQPNTPRH